MSFFATGNRGIDSTQAMPATNPDSNVQAEVDLNGTNATCRAGGEPWIVNWYVGAATTLAAFRLEQVTSTGNDFSTNGVARKIVFGTSNASAQYVTKHWANPGDRFRIKVHSTFTGSIAVGLCAEPLA